MNTGDLNYGIHKKIRGEMYFFPSEYDAGTIMRQLSQCANLLQEKGAPSNLRVEAPVFIPQNMRKNQNKREEVEEEKENEDPQDKEETIVWNTATKGVVHRTMPNEILHTTNRCALLEDYDKEDGVF